MNLLQWFLLVEQDANLRLIVVEPMFTFDFNSSKCCCKVQRTCKQVIMDIMDHGSCTVDKVFISWHLTVNY